MNTLMLTGGFLILTLASTVWLLLAVITRYKTKSLSASLFDSQITPKDIDYGECPPSDDCYSCNMDCADSMSGCDGDGMGDCGDCTSDCDCDCGGIEYADDYFKKSKVARAKYIGKCRIPSSVYVGDSRNLTIDLHLSVKPSVGKESSMKFQKEKDGLNLQILCRKDDVDELEFELVAAGFQIEGDKKQKQRLNSNRLQYQWNCFFPNSGQHHFSIVGRLLGQTHKEEIGRIEDVLIVVKVDHMTQRQVWILTTIAGIISGILSVAIALQTLGF